MKKFDVSQAPLFDQSLAMRETELCALLSRYDRRGDGIDDGQAEQAAHELEQVLGARRRLADGRYGDCIVCGKPIDVARLLAMPSWARCPACPPAPGGQGPPGLVH